jgi:hypothetical protein
MTLTAPDVGTSRDLARLAVTVHAKEPGPDERAEFQRLVEDGPVRALAAPAPAALSSVAAEIGGPAGELPLLGTDLRADDYEALRWNAARCGAADLPDVALLIAGLAAADEFDLASAAASVPLCRAVLAGRAVVRAAEALITEPATVPARPSYGVLGAAVTCALLGGASEEDLAVVLDLAASLMVTVVAGGDARSLAAGHACAAGWLAVAVWRAGVTPLPGAVAHTASVVAGRPIG